MQISVACLLLFVGAISAKGQEFYGDIRGTANHTIVVQVGGQTASNVAQAVKLVGSGGTSGDVPNTLVGRDSNGNFATNMITLDGTTTNATDAATKAYVDSTVSTGVNGNNIGSGAGEVFKDKTGVNLNLRTIAVGDYLTIDTDTTTNNTITIGTNATSNVVPDTIVARDSSGNFNASLFGDVIGDLSSTEVVTVGSATASQVSDTVLRVASATSVGTASSLLALDSFGNFAANTLTANLTGNATTATTATSATNFSGSLVGDVTGTQGATVVSTVGGLTASSVASGATAANNATDLNTANTIVMRDSSGEFRAGGIFANGIEASGISGTYISALAGFTGDLTGNVTGDVTGSVTGAASLNVLKAGDTMTGQLAMPAGSAENPAVNYASDGTTTGTGLYFPATHSVSLSTNGSERLNVDTSGTVKINGLGGAAGVVHNDSAGNLSSSLVVNADISSGAAIADTKLATISTAGKVANSATTATSSSTGSTIVLRDSSSNFSAGTISANLTGNVTGSASLNVLKAGDTMTGALVMPTGSALSPSIAFTNGAGLYSPSSGVGISTGGSNRLNVDSSGIVSISNFGTDGVVHNDSSGNLSSSLVVNADISSGAAIADTKLATISTAGKVANSATTATSSSTGSTIVLRDSSSNFSAGTISANLTGNVTGSASLNVLKAGDTMTGQLAMPAGSAQNPAVNYASDGTTTGTGLYFPATHSVSLSTNGAERLNVNTSGTVKINGLGGTAGVVHNDSSGNLSSSLIVNADISSGAAIADTKLATISTAGKVANSATTATSSSTGSTIVLRDSSSNFSAGTISANLTGNVTGSASLNVLKAGDTMTGALTMPAGNAVSPALAFSGGAGIYSSGVNGLAITTAGTNRLNVDSSGVVTISNLSSAGVVHNDNSGQLTTSLVVDADVASDAAIADTKLATISTAGKVDNSATTATNANTASTIVARDSNGDFSAGVISAASVVLSQFLINQGLLSVMFDHNVSSVSALADTGILFLRPTEGVAPLTINFPPSPTNGQFFTIVLGDSPAQTGTVYTVGSITNASSSGSVINGVTSLSPSAPCVSYYYYGASSSWYRCG